MSALIHHVVVLDMQPIEPPIGGGRLRLLGLYHGLGEDMPTTYVGTYDWPGPGERRHKLSATLEEIDIPLSSRHFEINEKWKALSGGKILTDVAFPLMAHLSPKFVEAARSAIKGADIVVFSHPWVYPLVRSALDDTRQLVVYDSHNFEGLLRAELLDDRGFGSEIVKHVIATEHDLAHRADLLIACSKVDCQLFRKVYGVESEKLRVVPNGVFVASMVPPTPSQKSQAKKALGISGKTAIFLGSAFGPNIEAAEYICTTLAPFFPDIDFLICGGVADAAELSHVRANSRRNVRFDGFIPENEKLVRLWAADIAVNPMFSGSGTNIKMFDFMASGLPTVATAVGARGIDGADGALLVSDAKGMVESIRTLIADEAHARQMGEVARTLVMEKYSWEKISSNLGHYLRERILEKRQRPCSAQPRRGHSLGTFEFSTEATDTEEPLQLAFNDASGRPGIAVITPWNVRCGIAEYSRHLASAIIERNVGCFIIADRKEDGSCRPDNIASPLMTVVRAWDYGNIEADEVVRRCAKSGIGKLNIQYHPAFFNEASLIEIVHKCLDKGVEASVTLHNTNKMDISCLRRLDSSGASLFIHNRDECRRLMREGIRDANHIPFGVIDIPDEPVSSARDMLGLSRSPVVGTFGFLRPHKGLLELIEATAIIRDLYPDVFLLAMTALYPSEDSEAYLAACLDLIRKLGIGEHVRLDTRFLEIQKTVQQLQGCDLIVLPYHHSDEGASASAHTALASRRPLLATREEIFDEISHVIYPLEKAEPHVLAAGVASVISSSVLLECLKNRVCKYVKSNSWASVADRYLELIYRVDKENSRYRNLKN